MSVQRPLNFDNLEAFANVQSGYETLPYRHVRFPGVPGKVLVTSAVGEYLFLTEQEFSRLAENSLNRDSDVYQALRSRQIVCDQGRGPFIEGLRAQHRTRHLFAGDDPALHIFVVTLRCDHRCHYCQVSPRRTSESGYDMTAKTADAALDRVFESNAPTLTIEFQGGESVLAFDRVRYIVERAVERASKSSKHLRFVLTSTLHLLTDEMLTFCRDYSIDLSTSLDGPAFVHDQNRINPTRDSFDRTIEGIERARLACGHDRVSALATITRNSLAHAREIIDTYVDLGFRSISLRPLSPFGFAVKAQQKLGYSAYAFLSFYREALDYLVRLNLRGKEIEESYATLLLTRILTPYPTSYVDLQSPCAAGSGVLVYNYDGGVYPSDEARMLAEMGDGQFRMGHVSESLATLRASTAMNIIRETGTAETLPHCSKCAFVPYCGADPIFHVATQRDPVGDKPTSEFCQRHMGLFRLIFQELAKRDQDTWRVFLSWIRRKPVTEVSRAGYMV